MKKIIKFSSRLFCEAILYSSSQQMFLKREELKILYFNHL